jgi:hypothetical protein
MFEASGLWLQKDKNGNSYMSGSMGKIRVLVFKDANKGDNEKAPDYRLCFAESKPKDGSGEDKKQQEQDDNAIPF